MMRTLDEEVFEAFKVPPKWFTRFLPELHDILSNDGGFVNWVEFLKKILKKSSHVVIESTAKLYNHFFARSFKEKGMKHNLTASSPAGEYAS